MKKLLFLLCALLVPASTYADTKIGNLPLGSASLTTSSDSLPYVNATTNITERLTLYDLINIPAFQDVFSMLVPSQTGQNGKCLQSNGTNTLWSTCGVVTGIGTFDSQTPSANGLVISGLSLYGQSASATNPGMVNVSAQTLAGVKTFSSAPILSALTASQAVVTNGSKSLTSLGYGSSNVVSTLVSRDSSGNFSAGTVTAALTGTASGNTTYSANNHGVVVSSSSNAMSVVAPDASTSKVLKSGGASADPSWLAYDNANTVSTLVARDGSGNFSAGTITAALSGNATTATTATSATTATTATNATNGATVATSSNASFFPLFAASSSNGNQPFNLGTGLSFNPSTNTLSTTAFSGALTGTASGNTTYSASNHGVVVSSATNAMTVLSPSAAGKALMGQGASSDPSFTATPTLGVAGTTAGTLGFSGVTSGVVTLATADAAGTWTMKLPTTAGSANQVLQTNGSGVTTWATNSGTSVQAQGGASNTLTTAVVRANQSTSVGSSGYLLESGNRNLIANPSFEASTFDSGWTVTTVTDAVETSTIIDGLNSAKLTYSSQTGGISQSVTPAVQTNGINYEASCRVLTTMTTIEVCGLSGGTSSNCQSVPATGTWQSISANFIGPSNGTTVGVKVDTTASGSGTVYVDDCYVGPARNLSQVSQAASVGSLLFSPASVCTWTLTQSTYAADYAAVATCNAATITNDGVATISSPGKLPQATVTNAPSGNYQVIYTGAIALGANVNGSCRIIDELSNVLGEVGFSGTPQFDITINGNQTYTTVATHTYKVQCLSASSTTNLKGDTGNGTNGFVIKYFPSQSQLAVSSGAQWQPTIQRFTSGSGTYTTPAGVSYIEVYAVGAGGGGAGSGTGTSGGTGGTGGNTTFGTSLITANGGVGGQDTGTAGGAGGTATVNSPALSIFSQVGSQGAGAMGPLSGLAAMGPPGGAGPMGGAGLGTDGSGGLSGVANSGGGGAGGASSSTNVNGGNAGGSGAYIYSIITTPSSSYSYAVGAAGTAGTAGTSGLVGGAGGSGIIAVVEHYNAQNAPNLIQSVTSNTSGSEHLERATITNNGSTATISSQSGTWLTSATRTATGKVSFVIVANEFSAAPTCWCNASVNSGTTAGNCFQDSTVSVTATAFGVADQNTTTGALQDQNFNVFCMGPR